MEAFSLLKYWRGGGAGGGVGDIGANVRTNATGTTTIVTAVTHQTNETDEEDDDDGPFFDLEFTVPDEDEAEGGDEQEEEAQEEDNIINSGDNGEEDDGEEEENDDVESTGTEGDREFNFTLSSDSSGDRTDPNPSLSPSDDIFFKGRLVPIEPSSLAFNASEPNSKPQFPVSLLKSATKFRVFMLGLKKAKSTTTEKVESNGSASTTPKQKHKRQQTQPKDPQQQQQQQQQSKFFTVKFKVEEVPIVSLFTRDNSSRSGKNSQKQNSDESVSDEKRFSKEVMQKYLKKVKPLYIRVSKRYGEKLRFSGQLSLGSGAKPTSSPPSTTLKSPSPTKSTAVKSESEAEAVEAPASNAKSQKQGNLPAGLRVVCKHLGKSRSASSAVAAVPSGPAPSRRRDDSLLQQQDGIQSAILHCKRSFNASRDSESSLLSRSASDTSHEKSTDVSRSSSEQVKDARV